jgi:hypothetical protein
LHRTVDEESIHRSQSTRFLKQSNNRLELLLLETGKRSRIVGVLNHLALIRRKIFAFEKFGAKYVKSALTIQLCSGQLIFGSVHFVFSGLGGRVLFYGAFDDQAGGEGFGAVVGNVHGLAVVAGDVFGAQAGFEVVAAGAAGEGVGGVHV